MARQKRVRTSQKQAISTKDIPRTRGELLAKKASGSFNVRMGSDVMDSSQTAFYSPILSTDFLQQPHSPQEKRRWYRYFYSRDPFVGQAIDLHSELPLSKIRLAPPECDDHDLAQRILFFYEEMCKKINLFRTLREIALYYWLFGMAFPFHEWNDETNTWERIILLDPDLVVTETVPFSDFIRVSIQPPPEAIALIKAAESDPDKAELVESIPEDIRSYIMAGKPIPLDTDPSEGSFVHRMLRKAEGAADTGQSILERVIHILIYRDKLRQAQTQIATRNMHPKRVVTAEGLSSFQVDDLREQVDLSILNPDYSIVANYQINWNEIGAGDRLLSLDSEMAETENQLLVGLGVTKDILTGQSTYSGARISLEIINARYLLFREVIQEYVEEYIFKPVAQANGFVGKDKFDNDIYLYPKLQFNRMALRDNQDTFDALFTLYQKGSLPISAILDLFNIDPNDVKRQLEEDMGTVNDSKFNDFLTALYNDAGSKIVDQTDIIQRLAKYLNIQYVPQAGDGMGGGGGFGGGGAPPPGLGGGMPPMGDMPPEGEGGPPPEEGGEAVPPEGEGGPPPEGGAPEGTPPPEVPPTQ